MTHPDPSGGLPFDFFLGEEAACELHDPTSEQPPPEYCPSDPAKGGTEPVNGVEDFTQNDEAPTPPEDAGGEGDSYLNEGDQQAVPSDAGGSGGSGDGSSDGGSVGNGDEGSGENFQDPEVTFGHGARHLEGYDLSQEDVEGAIEADVIERARAQEETPPEGDYYVGSVPVDDSTIEYRAYQRPQNTVNVGTYYIVDPEE